MPTAATGIDPALQPVVSKWDPRAEGKPHPQLGLFPFDTIRDGQRRFTRDVTMAVNGGNHLIAQAPTGIGKTAAVLAPALADAIDHGRTVFFLTSRQSQHRIAVETLRSIARTRGVVPKVVDLVGKRDMCLRPEVNELHPGRFPDFCSKETRNKSCSYLGEVDDFTIGQIHAGVLHVEELMAVSKEAHLCPHMVAMEAATKAHVVVADYNHIFSDIRDQSLEKLGVELQNVTVIVDEAHNLGERIKQSHGHKITPWLLNQVEAEIKSQRERALLVDLSALRKALDRLAMKADRDGTARTAPLGGEKEKVALLEIEDLVETFREVRHEGNLTGGIRSLGEFVDEMTPMVRRIKKGTDAQVSSETLLNALDDWGRFQGGALRYLKWDDDGVELNLRLLDPGVAAREVFNRVHCAILQSGTIDPEMTRDILGLDPERTRLREYPSPFPPENRLVVVGQNLDTRYKNRNDDLWARYGATISNVVDATRGNVAVFAPSYSILNDVRFASKHDKKNIVEDASWGKAERDQVLQDLVSHKDDGGAVLWGVLGGSFSEGVDFNDGLLSAVMVVGLPLAPPDLEQETTQAYLDKRYPGKGRLYGVTMPAMGKVLQAMGRGIRGPDDKCAILLLDSRYQGPPFRNHLPETTAVTPNPIPLAVGFLQHHGL